MPNYELTEHGLVTSDPAIGSMFVGEEVMIHNNARELWFVGVGEFLLDPFGSSFDSITIPYAAIKTAIAPVEDEAFVEIGFDDVATDGLILYGANDTVTKPPVDKRLNWRVIILCQDYGELRDLLAAIERWR